MKRNWANTHRCRRRDPNSWFYSEKGVYDFHYSRMRQNAAADYIAKHNDTSEVDDSEQTHPDPVLCVGIVTVKRKQNVDYLNGTIGSMLVGLTAEERSAMNVQVSLSERAASSSSRTEADMMALHANYIPASIRRPQSSAAS